eukprot:TRINITY_DN1951_c0_g1_i2.p1 TRINITY_DN1951_c0_g1~~TRINITY_DN1951_c0_g1_i2.p1  ORF type:complete len:200 (+),score=34.24 TRINITY_DN1951_c0_g1_i2:116-715(+)
MNPIQKLWLKVLTPVAYVINEKLARRPGFFGKIGKFFIIGPREYGVHPLNKMFIYLNRRYMFGQAFMLHRYSVLKTLTHNGYHMIRPFKHLSPIFPILVFVGLLRWVFYSTANRGYDPDRLTYLTRRLGNQMHLPLNSMNQRTSANWIEINSIYGAEMIKRYHSVHARIIEERNKCSEEVKRTRYADSSYSYTPIGNRS